MPYMSLSEGERPLRNSCTGQCVSRLSQEAAAAESADSWRRTQAERPGVPRASLSLSSCVCAWL